MRKKGLRRLESLGLHVCLDRSRSQLTLAHHVRWHTKSRNLFLDEGSLSGLGSSVMVVARFGRKSKYMLQVPSRRSLQL